MLAGREPHKVKLREADSGLHRLWKVLVVFDGEGHMYLGPGWEHFACAHELQLGYFLVFHYDGDAMFTVKMFDNTMCRMYYQHDDDASKLLPLFFLSFWLPRPARRQHHVHTLLHLARQWEQ